MTRKRRPTLRTSHKIRIVNNDPDYERISGMRAARGKRFTAKVLACVGLVFLIPSSPFLIPPASSGQAAFAFGLLFELIAACYLLSALSIESRFND